MRSQCRRLRTRTVQRRCRLRGLHLATASSEEIRIQVKLTVLESQREELQLAWQEIVAGKRVRLNTLNLEVSAITERAMSALVDCNS